MSFETLRPVAYNHETEKRFVVTLNVTSSGAVHIRICEIACRTYRNSNSFGPGADRPGAELRDVFYHDVAAALMSILQSLRMGTQVVSVPGFLVEIPGRILNGVQFMATKIQNQSVSVIIRIGIFLGGINRAFSRSNGFDDPVGNMTSDLAADVICNVASPLLDICATAELGMNNAMAGLGELG